MFFNICNIYSQSLIKEKSIPFDDSYSGYGIPNVLFEYYDYTFEQNKILKINENSREIVFKHDSNDIYGLDYNPYKNLIVYIYGNLSVTIPGIYNIKNSENNSLKKLLFDDEKNRIYYSIAQPKWVNESEFIYYAVSYSSTIKDVFLYNINTQENTKIFSENEITTFMYDRLFKKIVYSTIVEDKRILCIYDLDTGEKEYIIEGRFINPILINKNLMVTKNLDSQKVVFIENGIIIKEESNNHISTFEKYNPDEKIIITTDYTDDKKRAFNIGIYKLILP